MYKKITLIAILFSLLGSVYNNITAQEVWSLEKCIKYAYENNLHIKQQELVIQQNKNNLSQSKLNFIPSLSASVNHSMNWGKSVNIQDLEIIENQLSQGTSLNIGASIKLLDGLSKINTVKSNKVQVEASIQEIEKLKNELSITITQSYLQVLLSKQILITAKRNFQSIQEQRARTKKMVDAGSQAYSALLEIESLLATERLQVVNSSNQVKSNLLILIQLLDLEYNDTFNIEEPELSAIITNSPISTYDELYNRSTNLPQIKGAELALKNSKLQLAISKGRSYPTISFSAGYGAYYNTTQEGAFLEQFNDSRNPSLGFNLSIPIFNNWTTNTNIRNSKLNVRNNEIELKRRHQTLYKEIQQAVNDALSLFEKCQASGDNVKSMAESFRYVEQKFNVGMLNGTDYTVAKTNLFKAESEYYQAKYQYLFQLKVIDFYKGIPITL